MISFDRFRSICQTIVTQLLRSLNRLIISATCLLENGSEINDCRAIINKFTRVTLEYVNLLCKDPSKNFLIFNNLSMR